MITALKVLLLLVDLILLWLVFRKLRETDFWRDQCASAGRIILEYKSHTARLERMARQSDILLMVLLGGFAVCAAYVFWLDRKAEGEK